MQAAPLLIGSDLSQLDDFTLALLTNATAISVSLFANLPFNPLKDFTPISTLGM